MTVSLTVTAELWITAGAVLQVKGVIMGGPGGIVTADYQGQMTAAGTWPGAWAGVGTAGLLQHMFVLRTPPLPQAGPWKPADVMLLTFTTGLPPGDPYGLYIQAATPEIIPN